jgi:hypothetical protein
VFVPTNNFFIERAESLKAFVSSAFDKSVRGYALYPLLERLEGARC